jgi:putative intracellular protease/amidase
MADQLTIVFPLYPGVTHLDFTGPHQFLARLPGAKLITASVGGAPVAADGLVFADLAPLETIERCDVLCVPGGYGCTDAMQDAVYMAAIRRLADGARYVTSVCTGSLILGAAGLLRNVLTGGGVTAGIDFALTLATELAGPLVAQAIQLALEYAPAPPFNAGRPETAPAAVLALVHERMAPTMQARRAAVERVAALG